MYAQVKDFKKFNAALSEIIPGSDDGIDEDSLLDLIIAATEDINNYLRVKYSVPLQRVPQTIKRACVSITKYYLYSDFSDVMDEEVKSEYKETIKELDKISKGSIKLAGVESSPLPVKTNVKAVKLESQFDNVSYFK